MRAATLGPRPGLGLGIATDVASTRVAASGSALPRFSELLMQSGAQDSELETRLLSGLSGLVEDLAAEERRRRVAWEEKAERSARELRAGFEADLARGACESRRLLTEAKREASEARKVSQPCHDFFMARELEELPSSFARLLQREVRVVVSSEVDKMTQTLSDRGHEKVLQACSAHVAEALRRERECEREREGQEPSRSSVERRLAEVEGLLKTVEVHRERRLAEVEASVNGLKRETQTTVVQSCREAETRLGSHFQQLSVTHSSLQSVMDRFVESWEKAWREEAEARTSGDERATEHVQALARAVETQLRALNDAAERARVELEREAKVRQDADANLLEGWRDLQSDMRCEKDKRGSSDVKSMACFEELRSTVSKVVAMVEHSHTSTRAVRVEPGPALSDPAVFTAVVASTAAQVATLAACDTVARAGSPPPRAGTAMRVVSSPPHYSSPSLGRPSSPHVRAASQSNLHVVCGNIFCDRGPAAGSRSGTPLQQTRDVGTPGPGYRV